MTIAEDTDAILARHAPAPVVHPSVTVHTECEACGGGLFVERITKDHLAKRVHTTCVQCRRPTILDVAARINHLPALANRAPDTGPRLSFRPLERYLPGPTGAAADHLGIDRTTLTHWRRAGVPVTVAFELAALVNARPTDIWGDTYRLAYRARGAA